MRRFLLALLAILILPTIIGCGGGVTGPDYGTPFGTRSGQTVYMKPGPPSHAKLAWNPTATPAVFIDAVASHNSIVHPDGTGINESMGRVAFGQVKLPAGSNISDYAVVVYAFTDDYYIQPLDYTTILIHTDLSWVCPSHTGEIHALLVRQGYIGPKRTNTLPAVDGVNVFAYADESTWH